MYTHTYTHKYIYYNYSFIYFMHNAEETIIKINTYTIIILLFTTCTTQRRQSTELLGL